MKRSFVEAADSPYQFKKMIEESLKSKAAGILSNQEFQQAAAFGLLEFQDNDDQLAPSLTPDQLLKFFSQVVSYHDNEHPQGTLKRIASKTDTHSEVPNEDIETAYKKLFGTSIDKDPAFKHFFESCSLDEALGKIQEADGSSLVKDDPKKYYNSHVIPMEGNKITEAHFDGLKRANTATKTPKGVSVGIYGRNHKESMDAVRKHLRTLGLVEGRHFRISQDSDSLLDHLQEALEKWVEKDPPKRLVKGVPTHENRGPFGAKRIVPKPPVRTNKPKNIYGLPLENNGVKK